MTAHGRLLERDAELAALRGAIDEAASGAGQVILVEGPPGVGKSVLLSAACARAGDGMQVLRATGSELERDFAFGASRQLFEPLLTCAPEPARHRLLEGSAAPAEWVIDSRHSADDARVRAEGGFAVLQAIYWLVANAAEARPVLLAVDDLHWVDEPSLRALAFLASRIGDLPVGLAAATRRSEPGAPAELIDAIRGAAHAKAIAPAPLSRVAVAAVVREQVPGAGDDLCEAFYDSSAGNPLYLRELLLSTGGSGVLSDDGAARSVRDAAVPALAERLSWRIAKVAPEAELLTSAMSVLGNRGSLRLAADMAALGHEAAARIARRLTDIEVLAADDPFVFAHPVLRRSLYDRIVATDREALHANAARLLREGGARPAAIAVHVSALAPSGSSAAAAALLEAARDATARAAPEAAIPLLERALAEEAAEPRRWVLAHHLGRARTLVRDPSAVADLQWALDHADEPIQRATIAIDLADLLAALGQWDDFMSMLDRGKSELGDRDDDLMAELELIGAIATAFDPRFRETFDRAAPRYEELSRGDSWAAHGLAAALASVAGIRCEKPARIMPLVESALRGGRLLRERGGGGYVTPYLIHALLAAGEYDRALRVSDEVATVGRRSGATRSVIFGTLCKGLAQSLTGDLVAAEGAFRTVAEMLNDSARTMWLASIFHFFVDALLERPQLADLAAMVDAIELDPSFARTGGGAQLLEVRGRLALQRNEKERGLADLRAAGATFAALGVGPTWSQWRSVLALALPQGERERAMGLVGEEIEMGRAMGRPELGGPALRAAGMLTGGTRGIDLLRDSVTVLEASRSRLEHARSLVELGAALRRSQRRAEAREHLASGMELAYRCGAERLQARAEEELRAGGARPRRVDRSGIGALTPSELRVARMAAAGRSNLDIAQTLYVSTKTVETQLSSAYAKLNIRGRGARGRLAHALGDSPAP